MKKNRIKEGKKKRNSNSNISEGFTWGILIFAISLCMSVILFLICRLSGVADDYSALVIGIVDSAVGAITGGFIIPQLKGSHEVEVKDNEIHVIEFYHSFITYWLETDKMFIEHPECRKYFYSDIPIDGMDKNSSEYQLIMSFAEYFDDLFRYSPSELNKQLKSFSVVPYDQIESYISYMEGIMKRPAFLQYLADNHANVNSNNDNSDILELKKTLAERKREEGYDEED